MKNEKYKIIKITKVPIFLTIGFIIAGIIINVIFIALNLPIGSILHFNIGTNIGLEISATYLFIFIIFYKFIYKKTKHLRTFLRIILYAIFASFSATSLLFTLFNSVFQYSHFLRYGNSISYSIDSVSPALYLVLVVGVIGFIVLTTVIEIRSKINNFVKPLIYWFFTILVSWYISVPVLILITGWKYQTECTQWGFIDKSIRAQEYCYTIGEPLYYNWTFVPACIMIASQVFLAGWYFIKK